ncbi:multicopper oxidase-domain-containing protein, partial [Cokeromyces recurvatus]|uniref:multicopper oxidase-domain-containing protein n=1 Tax=Cokeromyces recurvatus TaxID=90255 RepID=UPI00221FE407
YEFNITSHLLNPDCHTRGYRTPLINGQFPGPTIHITQGDEIEILVRNQAQTYNTSIHFHGIRQIGTPESDGVPGITQHPIMPGTSFLHRFSAVGQAGTYFYHAHIGLQDDTVKGAFIIYESDEANPKMKHDGNKKKKRNYKRCQMLKAGPYSYKKDLVLQVSEWWHDDLLSREEYYLGNFFTFDHGADSILMNGRTIYDPDTLNLTSASCQGYTTFDVEPNSVYRLRVIGSTTFRTLALAIKEHPMTLIEIDGELTEPYQTSFLEIAPGQRYSALLKTGNHPPGTTFAIGTSYLWKQRGGGITENGFAYIRYVSPDTIKKEKEEEDRPNTNNRVYADLPLLPNVDEPDWFYHQIKPLAKRHPILDERNVRTIKLTTSFHVMIDNTTRYMVNNRIQSHHETANLHSQSTHKNKTLPQLSQHGYDYHMDLDTYPIQFNETLDLVFQNSKNAAGGCLLHPWHTHGHSHYLIASGQGDYVHERDSNKMNFEFPLYRDTSVAYPSMPTNDTDGCGWTKVRMKADNPGFWAVHCHITTHMLQGKMVILEEAPELI